MGKSSPLGARYFVVAVGIVIASVSVLLIGALAGWVPWGNVVPIVFTLAVCLGLTWACIDGFRYMVSITKPRDPREILDQRLAHGEIDVEEYHRLRAALESQTPA